MEVRLALEQAIHGRINSETNLVDIMKKTGSDMIQLPLKEQNVEKL